MGENEPDQPARGNELSTRTYAQVGLMEQETGCESLRVIFGREFAILS
jgi:hypothetical protein